MKSFLATRMSLAVLMPTVVCKRDAPLLCWSGSKVYEVANDGI